MLKYVDVMETFSEVPDEITLAINISGCPGRCPGCHSPYLQQDIGDELKPVVVSDMIAQHSGISCIAFLGGDNDVVGLSRILKWVKNNTELKTCWYSGKDELKQVDKDLVVPYLDYLKYGSYKEELGPLSSPKTNQKFLKKEKDGWEDITDRFQIDKAN
jgi:anaerobic ribonucleoside-triphosphate reductase activating protein